jgi:hypothetical protein
VKTKYDSFNHPVSLKKFHLPHGASQGKRSTLQMVTVITPWESNISSNSHKFPAFCAKVRLNFRLHGRLTTAVILTEPNFNPHYKLCFFNNRCKVFNLRTYLLPPVFATNTLSFPLLLRACHFPISRFVSNNYPNIIFKEYTSHSSLHKFFYPRVTSFLLGPDILICFLF